MKMTQLFQYLYGKPVTALKAYGKDRIDFTPDLSETDFSVGEFGYVVFKFGDDSLYVCADGLSSTAPPKDNISELHIPERMLQLFLGAVLQSISFDGEEFYVQFEGFESLRGYYEPYDGDRKSVV